MEKSHKKILIMFGIGGLIILALILYLVFKGNSDKKGPYNDGCKSDKDCGKGENCVLDPEYNKKVCSSGKYCNISPNSKLTPCNMDENDCKKCINTPGLTCVSVTDKQPYKGIPNGNWCLPPFKPTDIKCNPKTSDIELHRKVDDNGKPYYEWDCVCKNRNVITKYPGNTDCNIEVACGHSDSKGDLYVRDKLNSKNCKEDEDCGKGGEYCYNNICYKKWTKDNKSDDPFIGVCKCNSKLMFDPETLSCIEDPCVKSGHGVTKYTSGGEPYCECDPGWLRCPDPNLLTKDVNNTCNPAKTMRTCVKDACGYGKASQTYGCDCDDGYIASDVGSATSPTGRICIKPCDNINNPCDIRGKCTTKGQKGSKDIICCPCNSGWTNFQDKTMTCSNVAKSTDPKPDPCPSP